MNVEAARASASSAKNTPGDASDGKKKGELHTIYRK